jgi:hypothetical protein
MGKSSKDRNSECYLICIKSGVAVSTGRDLNGRASKIS